LGPWVESEVRRELTGRIPAMAIADGEGRVAREQEEDVAHLLEGSRGRIEGRRVLVAGGQGTAAEGIDDGGALARDGQNQTAGELHRVTVNLSRGSGCRGGAVAADRQWTKVAGIGKRGRDGIRQ
jgi:hypothetical protein